MLTIFLMILQIICIERNMVDPPVVLAPVVKKAGYGIKQKKEEEREDENLLKADTKL